MTISEDRQAYLAHEIVDGIWGDDLVDFVDDDQALRVVKRAIALFVKEDEQLDTRVREKLRSLKRGVPEGGNEWETLYKKYYEEELGRRG